MKVAHVNAVGMEQVSAALSKLHKLDISHFNFAMLHAWAAEAEQSFENDGVASFEIKSRDSVSGHTELVTISADGLDIEEIEGD